MKSFLFNLYKILYCFRDPLCFRYYWRYKPEVIFIAGTNYTFLTETQVIKIPNKKRIVALQQEFKECKIWKIMTKEEELQKFQNASNGKGKIDSSGVVLLERFLAKPLSSFLESKKFIVFFEKSIQKLIALHKKTNFSHGDFHIDNILVDAQENILFIDFDYAYEEEYLCNAPYRDILHLIFIFKKEYKNEFTSLCPELQRVTEVYFEKKLLQQTMQEMECFFQMEYSELW